jgi:hypothetical protein
MEAPSLPAVSVGLFRCLVFDVFPTVRLMSPPIAPGGRTLLRGRKWTASVPQVGVPLSDSRARLAGVEAISLP